MDCRRAQSLPAWLRQEAERGVLCQALLIHLQTLIARAGERAHTEVTALLHRRILRHLARCGVPKLLLLRGLGRRGGSGRTE